MLLLRHCKAAAIVGDISRDARHAVSRLLAAPDPHLGRPGVGQDIADRFLKNAQHVEGIGRVKPRQRPALLDLPAAHHPGIAQIALHPVTQIADERDQIAFDRFERIHRDLEVGQRAAHEVETTTGKKVLAPMMVAVTHGNSLIDALLPIIEDKPKFVEIDAITAAQFESAPGLATPGIITRYEEDRVQAYFGGGYMYATPERSEAWI
mgnify:CR=1 FL=1